MSISTEEEFNAKCSLYSQDAICAWAREGRIEVFTDGEHDPGPTVWMSPDDAEAFGRWLIARAQELRSR